MSYARDGDRDRCPGPGVTAVVGGRIAQSALAGEPFLRPEMFSLLPLPTRRRLGWSLLLVGLLDPANVLVAVALSAVLVHGIRLGAAPAVTAVFAVAFTVTAGSVLSTVAAGILGPGTHRGRDIGTMIVAIVISLLAMAGTMLPALMSALRHQSVPWLSVLLRLLPTGWGPGAVAAAAQGDLTGMLARLLGLVLVSVLAGGLLWPAVLAGGWKACGPPGVGRPADAAPGRAGHLGDRCGSRQGTAPVAA